MSRFLDRRQLLRWMGASTLSFWPPARALARSWSRAGKHRRRPRARSVIQIWMWGGPSHLDTFDPKPEAGADYCGPYLDPIESNVPGIRVGQKLPRMAQQMDKVCLIRSLSHGIQAHETAAYMVQTGREPGREVFPSAGAVVSRFLGVEAGYQGVVPPYVVLTKPQGRFSESGLLGPRFKPFVTGGDPAKPRFEVEGLVAPGIDDARQEKRRELLRDLDSLGRAAPLEPAFQRLDALEEEAYAMIFGKPREVFDLGRESDALRDRYGRNHFGQSCLQARRLVEEGVPFVTINYQGWDTHKMHFQTMERKLPELDQGLSALLEDLHQRGLLESTVVWWSGEFGRGPRIQWEPPWNGGRSHHGHCFSALLAGGGFRGGQVLGASDARGHEPADRPVHPAEVLASLYSVLGIDPAAPLPNERGLQVPVLPEVGRPLEELL